ncbi:hypothetical protein HMPREF1977_1017 [Capnocytophaga ochracea F0287]|uniref:Uncharacterized protein n=1 Tax=Capnocytophaga ochracea F0287 TaxID=873517 RepID=E4MRK7_CAPOC|nr:hypothetical protein HMPREF1977_1017 [Capnocytophaga ochracea F0287]
MTYLLTKGFGRSFCPYFDKNFIGEDIIGIDFYNVILYSLKACK